MGATGCTQVSVICLAVRRAPVDICHHRRRQCCCRCIWRDKVRGSLCCCHPMGVCACSRAHVIGGEMVQGWTSEGVRGEGCRACWMGEGRHRCCRTCHYLRRRRMWRDEEADEEVRASRRHRLVWRDEVATDKARVRHRHCCLVWRDEAAEDEGRGRCRCHCPMCMCACSRMAVDKVRARCHRRRLVWRDEVAEDEARGRRSRCRHLTGVCVCSRTHVMGGARPREGSWGRWRGDSMQWWGLSFFFLESQCAVCMRGGWVVDATGKLAGKR